MKIVVDTNVLVAGLINPYGPPGEIVRMTSSGILQLCHDPRILSEYEEVLRRPKFGFENEVISSLLEQIRFGGQTVSAEPLKRRLPDIDDEIFLEVAISGHAKHLITGNLSDFKGHDYTKISVVSPSRFLDLYRNQ